MKVSVNWLRDINRKYKSSADPMPDGIDKLVERIGAQLGAVDEVVNVGKKYQGIFVAKIISCEKHPDADKLSICLIDDNQVVKGVKRNAKGLVQVVCGAPNARAGVYVAWIPPGVVVPSTLEKDPFKLESKAIRGQISNGMLASLKELALGENHEGILEIDEKVKPGQPFAEVYGLDDYIIDIENKMFTHRPDLFGLLGVARELAGIQGHSFKSPTWYREDAAVQKSRADGLKLRVKNELPKLVPRFSVVVIKDVKVTDSPVWLQSYLFRVGIRPINNIVDLTNFFMHETAQPLHAYDYDKLGDQIIIRNPKVGETLEVIGGKNVKLQSDDIVIASTTGPVGLGGVMGGVGTQVDSNTRNIVLEAATFDMNSIRKTAMAHGLFTDAATRFTKNQSPRQNAAVIVKAANDVLRIAGGRVVSDLIDNRHFETSFKPVDVDVDFINDRLGLSLSAKQIKILLENVEFEVSEKAGKLHVIAPFWRTDIAISEDIVEEVGRLHGYDQLPLVLPKKDLTPATADGLLDFKARLRHLLKAAGMNEVLSYSFVHGNLLEKAGQDASLAFHIRNALSPDLQYYRLSVVPSLLTKVHPNIKTGYERFGLFELGQIHIKGLKDKQKLPATRHRLAWVLASKKSSPTAPYYEARKYTELLLSELNIQHKYLPLDEYAGLSVEWKQVSGSFETGRSGVVRSGNDKIIGLVGEPSQALRTSLKLPASTSLVEFDTELLLSLARPTPYAPLDKYPILEQDITLRLSSKTSYGDASDFFRQHLQNSEQAHGYKYEIIPVDIFQKENEEKHKQMTWRIRLWHPDRTLTTEESNRLLDGLAAEAGQQIDAQRI